MKPRRRAFIIRDDGQLVDLLDEEVRLERANRRRATSAWTPVHAASRRLAVSSDVRPFK